MKMIGLIMVMVGCTLCGFIIDREEQMRIKDLEAFIYVLQLLRAEIDYRLTPLKEACLLVREHAKGSVGNVLVAFEAEIQKRESTDLEKMWIKALASQKYNLHLKQVDYELLDSFGAACGYLDKEMQKTNIDRVVLGLQKEAERASTKYQKNAQLNRYLGFLIGACISIFLI